MMAMSTQGIDERTINVHDDDDDVTVTIVC